MSKIQTAERVSQTDMSDNFVFQRSMLAYHHAAQLISGDVLEIGTGSGYGVSVIACKARRFVTVDKHVPPVDPEKYPNVEFLNMKVPPLMGLPDDSFDFVITFQVIEHIRNDRAILAEIRRVLKPGGKLIITTPNRKMSLSRNPWHIREYTPDQFSALLGSIFTGVKACGVFGNEKITEYYERNRESVKRFEAYDILRFNRWLPKVLLRIPYDILNRINRRKLLENNENLTSHIVMEDYAIGPVTNECYDLFYIAEK